MKKILKSCSVAILIMLGLPLVTLASSISELEHESQVKKKSENLRKEVEHFERQLFIVGTSQIDSKKFQEIYGGEQGATLFNYGQALKQLEELSTDKGECITCLDKLFNLVKQLSKDRAMCRKAPPLTGGKDENRNIFSDLGYADRLAAYGFLVSIDQMFLEDPNLMLFTIDLQRKWLTKSGGDFEDFLRDLLEEWEPKFSNSTINKLNTIILMPS